MRSCTRSPSCSSTWCEQCLFCVVSFFHEFVPSLSWLMVVLHRETEGKELFFVGEVFGVHPGYRHLGRACVHYLLLHVREITALPLRFHLPAFVTSLSGQILGFSGGSNFNRKVVPRLPACLLHVCSWVCQRCCIRARDRANITAPQEPCSQINMMKGWWFHSSCQLPVLASLRRSWILGKKLHSRIPPSSIDFSLSS